MYAYSTSSNIYIKGGDIILDAGKFLEIIETLGDTFYTGVPDSLLSPFIDKVMEQYGVSDKHIVAANEGAAVGLAAGHYLATSRPAIVYMQNSGIGNTINPICSLLHEKVYNIPVVFVIGWRGEPSTKDEPQHVFQGEATLSLLDCLEIPYVVVGKDSNLTDTIDSFRKHLEAGKSVAFVIRKDALTNNNKMKYASSAPLSREQALETILERSTDKDIYVCTTGKLSREVFEIRKQANKGHGHDFLTVGSMGHSLAIAHGIAIAKPEKKIWCLDGDGAILMHMGTMAVVSVHSPKNLIHVVINNGAHETVGGLPAVSTNLNLSELALAMGYNKVFRLNNQEDLSNILYEINGEECPVFIEIICNLTSRADLGRPTNTPIENKNALMSVLSK